MRNHLKLLMDRSSFYILKNRWKTSLIISLGIFSLTLLLVNTLIGEWEAPPTFNIFKINIIESDIPEKKTSADKIPKPEVVKKTEKIPEVIAKSAEPEKKEIVEVEAIPDEPVIEIESIESSSTSPNDKKPKENNGGEESITYSPDFITFEEVAYGLNLPEPTYPKAAIKWKKQGVVEVEILVNKDGNVEDIEIIKSSGHTILDTECINTIRKRWRFGIQNSEIKIKRKFIFSLSVVKT